MEKIFVDTSAIFALLATLDNKNDAAAAIWDELIEKQQALFTNNYVLVETIALTQSRLGLDFVRYLQSIIVPVLSIDWINEGQHEAIIIDVLTANRRTLTLVDCSAFQTMNNLGIETVFTFDEHFHDQGFKVIP